MEGATVFTGWVRHIFDADEFCREFVVANYDSEIAKENMRASKKEIPKALKIRASVRSGAAKQVDSIREGDKVTVEFYLCGTEGVSKRTGSYYAINELNLAKQKGITVIERAPQEDESEPPQGEESEPDDIPF